MQSTTGILLADKCIGQQLLGRQRCAEQLVDGKHRRNGGRGRTAHTGLQWHALVDLQLDAMPIAIVIPQCPGRDRCRIVIRVRRQVGMRLAVQAAHFGDRNSGLIDPACAYAIANTGKGQAQHVESDANISDRCRCKCSD